MVTEQLIQTSAYLQNVQQHVLSIAQTIIIHNKLTFAFYFWCLLRVIFSEVINKMSAPSTDKDSAAKELETIWNDVNKAAKAGEAFEDALNRILDERLYAGLPTEAKAGETKDQTKERLKKEALTKKAKAEKKEGETDDQALSRVTTAYDTNRANITTEILRRRDKEVNEETSGALSKLIPSEAELKARQAAEVAAAKDKNAPKEPKEKNELRSMIEKIAAEILPRFRSAIDAKSEKAKKEIVAWTKTIVTARDDTMKLTTATVEKDAPPLREKLNKIMNEYENIDKIIEADKLLADARSKTMTEEDPSGVNISTKADVPFRGMEPYSNIYYEALQNAFDNHRPFKKRIKNVECMQYGTPDNQYNASGNLKINATIPINADSAPNYCESLITGQLVIPPALKILLDTVMGDTLIAPTTIVNCIPHIAPQNTVNSSFKYEPNAPEALHVLLEESKTNKLAAWNLNYNRTNLKEKVPIIATHVISKINALIDYVITYGITTPNDKFRELVKEIFATKDGKVYSFSHYTLMLPALVNYYASNRVNEYHEHATRYVGLVNKGSALFPKGTNVTSFANEVKWQKISKDKIPKITIDNVCPYVFVGSSNSSTDKNATNEQKTIQYVGKTLIGAYNYPFLQKYNDGFRLTNEYEVKTNDIAGTVDKILLANIPLKYNKENDEYDYKAKDYGPDKVKGTVIAEMKYVAGRNDVDPKKIYDARPISWDTDYATEGGTLPDAKQIPATPGVSCTVEVPKKGIKKLAFWQKNPTETQSHGGWGNGIANWPLNTKPGTYSEYVSGRGCSGLNPVNTGTGRVWYEGKPYNYKRPNIQYIGAYDTGKLCSANNAYCAMEGDNPIVKKDISKVEPDIGTKYILNDISYTTSNGNSPVQSSLLTGAYSAQHKKYEPQFAQQERIEYLGEFGAASEGPISTNKNRGIDNSNESIIRDPRTTWLYYATINIRYFNENVYNDWLYLVLTESALKQLLKEIQEMLIANPELILLNKVNTVFGPYIRARGRPELGFIEAPIGMPGIFMPKSSAFPFKIYHGNYIVDNKIDPNNVVYNNAWKHNSIINTIAPDIANEKDYKPNNYLDHVYTEIGSVSIQERILNNDSVLGITVPNRGCKLFEALSEFQDKKGYDRIMLSKRMVSMLKMNDPTKKLTEDEVFIAGNEKTGALPRLVMTIGSPLCVNEGGCVGSIYQNVNGALNLHAPIINVKQMDNGYYVSINTSSYDSANQVYLYVSKPGNQLGASFMPSIIGQKKDKEHESYLVNIEYNGLETKATPYILQTRFEQEKTEAAEEDAKIGKPKEEKSGDTQKPEDIIKGKTMEPAKK